MVEPFPQPGDLLRVAMDRLQVAAMNPPQSEKDIGALTELPRPWDPGSCPADLRAELWSWLLEVSAWINTQHLWNVSVTGIPECWPQHPHLVHDLAAVASARHYTTFAASPAALDDWHHYCLTGFLDRLHHRLADGCQPGRHQQRPREERNRHYQNDEARRSRLEQITMDRAQAHDPRSGAPRD